VSFAAINFFVASQRVFIVVRVYFVIDSVRNFGYTVVFCEDNELWSFSLCSCVPSPLVATLASACCSQTHLIHTLP